MRRFLLAITFLIATAAAPAQSLGLPLPAYSYQCQTDSFRDDPVTVQGVRDHGRERREFTVTAFGSDAHPTHKTLSFDFPVHLVYVHDEAGYRTYRNIMDDVPLALDPAGGQGTEQEIGPAPKVVRTEGKERLRVVFDFTRHRSWVEDADGCREQTCQASGAPGNLDHSPVNCEGLCLYHR